MYICIYVYIYIYMCVCVCIYVYIHVDMYTHKMAADSYAVQIIARRNGPGTTELSCRGPQVTMLKCVGCAEQSKTRWARHD